MITARAAALKVLTGFEEYLRGNNQGFDLRQTGDRLLPTIFDRDKALFKTLVRGVLRWMRRLDAIISEFSRYGIVNIQSQALSILRIGLYELIYLSKIPDYASVDEAVNLVQGTKTKGFVNAVLREIVRNKDRIPLIPTVKNTQECIEFSLSYPKWLAQMLLERFGKEIALKAAQSLNEDEPLTIRVNRMKTSTEELARLLTSEETRPRQSEYCKDSLIIDGRLDFSKLDLYEKGYFYVQNASSQIVSHLLEPKDGDHILDACSAPGGKCTHISELTSGNTRIFALDNKARKLDLISENAKRLGLSNITTVMADASKPLPSEIPTSFDKILADLPCSALGTIRKNPEIKRTRSKSDIDRLSSAQLQILGNLKKYLKESGTLLYSVCTFSEEETNQLALKFLKSSPEFRIDPIREIPGTKISDFITKEGFLAIPPLINELESFFIARFKKT
jgi:16S rRNA (cytosine967-C5)-methyltransferase